MRRWRGELSSAVVWSVLLVLITAGSCDGARRRVAQRRSDTRSTQLSDASPSAETLQALAEAMGAAGFEHHTEGRPLVKRLIPTNTQSDLDVVEHQGVIGKAGVDFPAFPNIPNTGFNCKNVPTGYYADLETDCQVFHICDTSRKISFLCPNGTIFSQSHLICDWWFKVDCASSPALYESSAEYYSNEQKKSQKITKSLSKNADLQHLVDTNRAESRRTSVNIPSTTERLLRHRQRLSGEIQPPKATSRSFQAFFPDSAFNPTQRTQITTTFDKRRKNLVQLISNNFGNTPVKTTLPTYTDASTYRTNGGDFNGLKEMQVAAESASFTSNNNRQYLQDYQKNFRPYPVYMANIPKSSNSKGNPTLTTLYSFQDRNLNQIRYDSTTTKRPTLLPYTKSYTTVNEKREPYTRPGISLLKDYLEKEKNRTAATTENIVKATARSDIHNNLENKITIESKNSFESVTRIPQTARTVSLQDSTDKFDAFPSTNQETQVTTEPNYQERRERLMRKFNLDNITPTEPTVPTERYYGDQPNRPGLVVPPSLTPKTLHSLAIYYATAIDNLSTALPTDETETSTPNTIDFEAMEEALPALFSDQTINKYSRLFGEGAGYSELLNEIKLDPNGTYNELADDLAVQQSQNPIASSPQIRELAQVFTHALSAYLQDPVQFRKVLSDIRPTQPSFGDLLTSTDESFNTEPTTTVNEEDDEILGFSDENKARPALASLRDGKALNIGSDYSTVTDEPSTTQKPFTTEIVPTTYRSTTYKHPFKCCGRISASYTSASTPSVPFTSPISYNTAANVNTLANNNTESYTTTEDSYSALRFGGFQNNTQTNNSPYGKGQTISEPLSEYVEATNLPSAWGVDTTSGTLTNGHTNVFESKKIRTTTAIPTTTQVYLTETDSVELENEEELQRAHSQSFVQPQNQRQGKNSKLDFDDNIIRKPSEDLEAPTVQDTFPTTVQTSTQVPTTFNYENEATTASSLANGIYTSSDNQDATQYQWPTTYGSWQSTIVDPITLNDGLSLNQNVPEQLSHLVSQTNSWLPNTATTPVPEYTATSEQSYSPSSHIELTTPGNLNDERFGRVLKELTSTEPNPNQDLTTIAETVVEKAKEIMGGMNATTTEKLMNVMKKTKSKTVRRLILLLVQTCDDDHNSTAEASKRALLEALMTVSQKDMDQIAEEEGVTDNPTTANDIYVDTFKTTELKGTEEVKPEVNSDRRGKSLDFDPSAINALSNPTTTESPKTTEPPVQYTTTESARTTVTNRRGVRKFLVRTSQLEPKSTASPFVDSPRAEARVAAQETEVKTTSDTRALELLRSLYSIAAKWG